MEVKLEYLWRSICFTSKVCAYTEWLLSLLDGSGSTETGRLRGGPLVSKYQVVILVNYLGLVSCAVLCISLVHTAGK